MNISIRKRSVISVLVIIAVICSAGVFTACGGESEEFRYNITITSYDNSIETDFPGVLLQGVDGDPTVLDATRYFCREVMQWDFEYDAAINSVKRIYTNISELFRAEFEEECEECAALAADEDSEEDECAECAEKEEEAVRDYYYDWVCAVNGAEAQPNDLIKNGDSITWEWKQVQKELVD